MRPRVQVRESDVLCRRGRFKRVRPADREFMDVIQRFASHRLPGTRTSGSRTDRGNQKDIVELVKSELPSDSRFLSHYDENTNTAIVMKKEELRAKIGQAIRYQRSLKWKTESIVCTPANMVDALFMQQQSLYSAYAAAAMQQRAAASTHFSQHGPYPMHGAHANGYATQMHFGNPAFSWHGGAKQARERRTHYYAYHPATTRVSEVPTKQFFYSPHNAGGIHNQWSYPPPRSHPLPLPEQLSFSENDGTSTSAAAGTLNPGGDGTYALNQQPVNGQTPPKQDTAALHDKLLDDCTSPLGTPTSRTTKSPQKIDIEPLEEETQLFLSPSSLKFHSSTRLDLDDSQTLDIDLFAWC